ncbi:MAG: ADP-ribose pyrophosphatase, partial [Candidatus Eremiobacteraeota bacterium]|nr:ADP-ribose pyrophosphatase [Candidatus Eremiobacteraeota bacterium]
YENPWLSFEAHDIVHPNGTPGVHGVVVTPRASAVVLVDGDDVLLVRQARFAVDRVVLEVVKGGRHDGEDGLACAQRESREEAGVVARRWIALGETYEIPSIVQEPVSLYVGVELTPAPLAPEDVERIDVVRMRLDDALDACAHGRIDDAVTAIALLRAHAVLASER